MLKTAMEHLEDVRTMLEAPKFSYLTPEAKSQLMANYLKEKVSKGLVRKGLQDMPEDIKTVLLGQYRRL